MITVYYDGACGLCAKEINYYKSLAPNNIFEWIDIVKNPEKFTQMGYTLEEGLKILHVKKDSNSMQIGVNAFIAIWQQLPYWCFAAKIAALPIINPLLQFTYKHLAAYRYKKMLCKYPSH